MLLLSAGILFFVLTPTLLIGLHRIGFVEPLRWILFLQLLDPLRQSRDFRLQLHASALNLLVLLRRTVRETLTPQMLSLSNDLPHDRAVEALAGPERPRYFHRRRDRDPLGEGHIETWRTRLIKVAAEVIVSARRIVVRLAPGWPRLNHFAAVSNAVLNLPAIGTQ